MVRRGITAFLVGALGVGLIVAPTPAPAHAASGAVITNISVGAPGGITPGGTVTYNMCVAAPSPPPSGGGGEVAVTAPNGQTLYGGVVYSGQTCGISGIYFLTGSLSVSATGQYLYQAACIFATPNWNTYCVSRNAALFNNSQGLTVGNSCQVDFTVPSGAMAFNTCNGGQGNINGSGPAQPTATPAPPTATSAPPTNTPPPPPPATNTPPPPPPPTNTPPPPPAPTNTPVPPTATPVPPTSTPVPPPAPAPATPVPPTATRTSAGSSGPVTHPTKTEKSGPTLSVALLTPLVRPGQTARLRIHYAALAQVRVVVSFPGKRALVVAHKTDRHGQLMVLIKTPQLLKLRNGRLSAKIVITAARGALRAQKTVYQNVSDMILAVAPGRFAKCQQLQTVKVAYYANTVLQILLSSPNGRHVTLNTRTDRHGNAAVQVRLNYVNAARTVRIGVQAVAVKTHRVERISVNVTPPAQCQSDDTASVTVGS